MEPQPDIFYPRQSLTNIIDFKDNEGREQLVGYICLLERKFLWKINLFNNPGSIGSNKMVSKFIRRLSLSANVLQGLFDISNTECTDYHKPQGQDQIERVHPVFRDIGLNVEWLGRRNGDTFCYRSLVFACLDWR
jgi:hypothetical protein